MHSIRPFIFFFLVQFPILLFAQEILTSEQAIKIALENNYSIRIARNQAEISSNNVTYGNAGFMPSVDLNVSQNNNIQNSKQEFLSGQDNEKENAKSSSFNLSGVFNWTLFDGLEMFTNYEKLKELEAMGELAARVVIERTIVSVLSSYYDLVRQKQRLQVIDKTISISEERIRLAEEKFQLGAASRLEILQAQVDYNADRSDQLNSEEIFRTSKIRLNNLLARDIALDFDVEDTIDTVSMPAWKDVYDIAMANNTYLQMNNIDTRLTSLELRSLNARRMPRLNANMGYSYLKSESEAGFMKTNQTSGINYGLSVGWNIFNGFNLNRQIANARIMKENAEIELMDSRSTLHTDLMATYLSLQSKKQLVDFESLNLEVADRNLAIAMERFRLGELSGFELREAQKNYLAAESRLITARYQAKIVELDMNEITGKILVF
ncbi:MAG: TolC family protein [Bacteroidales bacterium]|jgi:outer membrane protein TolC|nr:TolC family protein [Bacteroidales bacterium]